MEHRIPFEHNSSSYPRQFTLFLINSCGRKHISLDILYTRNQALRAWFQNLRWKFFNKIQHFCSRAVSNQGWVIVACRRYVLEAPYSFSSPAKPERELAKLWANAIYIFFPQQLYSNRSAQHHQSLLKTFPVQPLCTIVRLVKKLFDGGSYLLCTYTTRRVGMRALFRNICFGQSSRRGLLQNIT